MFPFRLFQNNGLKEQKKAGYFATNRHVELLEGGLDNCKQILYNAPVN